MLQPTRCNYHTYCIGILPWLNVKTGTFNENCERSRRCRVCIKSDVIKRAVIVLRGECYL